MNSISYSFEDDKLTLLKANARPKETVTPAPTVTPAQLPPYDQAIRQQDLDGAMRKLVTNASPGKAEVVYAELTGDRIEEALVKLAVEGQGGYIDAAVYTMADGKQKQLWRLPAADQLAVAKVGLGPNQSIFYIGAANFDGSNTRVDTTHSYIWKTSGFVKVQ